MKSPKRIFYSNADLCVSHQFILPLISGEQFGQDAGLAIYPVARMGWRLRTAAMAFERDLGRLISCMRYMSPDTIRKSPDTIRKTIHPRKQLHTTVTMPMVTRIAIAIAVSTFRAAIRPYPLER